MNYKTIYANRATIEKKWFVVDAAGLPLGRLTSQVAYVLRGKHKPLFTPHVDCGDHVIVLNAAQVALSGNKEIKKIYLRHSGYPGGVKKNIPQNIRIAHPTRLIEHAVKGMLPKNKLGRKVFHNLHVYADLEHRHMAQKPTKMILKF